MNIYLLLEVLFDDDRIPAKLEYLYLINLLYIFFQNVNI
jgi:hypothetical protein